MTPAITIPRKIDSQPFLKSNSRMVATSDPDQAPVPGTGIPTNMVRAKKPYFLTSSLLACSLTSYFVKKGPKVLVVFSHLTIFMPNSSRNGTGSMLEMMQIGSTSYHGIFLAAPKMMAPHSSIRGMRDIMNRANLSPRTEKNENSFCIIVYYLSANILKSGLSLSLTVIFL